MISFDQVTFTYHRDTEGQSAEAIAGLDTFTLDIDAGTLTVVTGASGSGKSTVTRLINGLIPHLTEGTLTGTVTVDGVVTAHSTLSHVGELSGTVFQNPRSQFFTSCVGEELAFARENAGNASDVIVEAVTAAARRAGIGPWLDCRLSELSGGELQRVACATVLAGGSRIMVLDEPTSNLSPQAISDLARLLAELKADGMTIVIAEHRLYFLRDLADRVVVLDRGEIQLSCSGAEFFATPGDVVEELGLRTLTTPTVVTSPMSAAMDRDGLHVDHLRFSYGSHRVLDIDELCFPRSQVTAITGPNGAGKTTLARVLTGLNKADHGKICLDGRALSHRQRRRVSTVVMQDVNRQLFAPTVSAEVVLGLDNAEGIDVAELLKAMDLDAVKDRHPMSLSGGQKQRLVIASALAAQAEIYIFDEPTSGVDLRHLREIAARVRHLAHRGAVVLVISHDAEFVSACADRIYHLEAIDGQHANRVTAGQLSHERHVHAR